MANLKSSVKDIRRIIKRTARNRQVRSELKTVRRSLDEAVANGEKGDEIRAAVQRFASALDKAAKRRIIHPNKANRHKSEFARFLVR